MHARRLAAATLALLGGSLMVSPPAQAVQWPIVIEGTACIHTLIPTCSQVRSRLFADGTGITRALTLGTVTSDTFLWRYHPASHSLSIRYQGQTWTSPIDANGCITGSTVQSGYVVTYDLCRV